MCNFKSMASTKWITSAHTAKTENPAEHHNLVLYSILIFLQTPLCLLNLPNLESQTSRKAIPQ